MVWRVCRLLLEIEKQEFSPSAACREWRYVPCSRYDYRYRTSPCACLRGRSGPARLPCRTGGSPDLLPGLLAWLEHAVGWEIDRGEGVIYPLLALRAAIDDSEVRNCLIALAVLAKVFRDEGPAASVPAANVLHLTASVLSAEVQRHDRVQ